MRKLYILLSLALLAIFATSCKNDEITYNGPAFLQFDKSLSSLSVREGTDGILTVNITISQEQAQDVTCGVAIVSTTGTEGTDFELLDNSITIPAGQYSAPVRVKGIYDNLTPEGIDINLKITSNDASLFQEDIPTDCKITLTRFFEITDEWLEGVWDATDYYLDEGNGYESIAYDYQLLITKVSETEVEILNIGGWMSVITGTLDVETGTISIHPDQILAVHPTYGNVYMDWCDGAYFNRTKPITAELTFRGITIPEWGDFVNDYSAGSAFGIYNTVLTKSVE
ncbi:MAG: hypothetical protein LBM07_02890 [Culturomica sp.]|jgi:hypothetical protein|nr:hypothetical protein [Culturomica sp.]